MKVAAMLVPRRCDAKLEGEHGHRERCTAQANDPAGMARAHSVQQYPRHFQLLMCQYFR